MAGNSNSGRKARALSAEEARYALRQLTRKSVQVIKDSLDTGEVGTAWKVIEQVIGKPRQAIEIGGHDEPAPDQDTPDRIQEVPQHVIEGAVALLLRAGVTN